MNWTMRSLAALGVAAGCGLTPISGRADTLDHAFIVETTTETVAETQSYRDVLVVHGDTGTGFIAGGNAGDAAALERDRSCFDVVGRVLNEGASRKPYPIGVALGPSGIVPVAMRADAAEPAAAGRSLIQAHGDATTAVSTTGGGPLTVGVHVDADVVAQGGRLQAASIRELTFVGDRSQPLAVTGCSLERIPAPAQPSQQQQPAATISPA